MLKIDGTTLISTDWHFGIKNSQTSRLKIMGNVVREIAKYIRQNRIDNLLFLGDMFHQRNNLSVQTINVAIGCIDTLSKICNVYLVLGNHDIYNKNTNEIHSLNIFRNTRNVTIISKPTEAEINGEKCLLAPWLTDLAVYGRDSFDMMFGHFDISPQYLLASYIEHNRERNVASDKALESIENDEMLRESGLDDIGFDCEVDQKILKGEVKSSDMIGSWIEIVKEGGTIFSGHIHNRSEFVSKGRQFIFVGSPYQQTLGEIDSKDGFYVLDAKNRWEFHPLGGIPVHVDLVMSRIVKNFDGFDFSVVAGNIVHKIYDIEVDRVLDAKITRKIVDAKPYEEITPEYDIRTSSESIDDETVNALKKSKLEYLHNYINSIDDSALEKDSLDRNRLFEITTEYYNMVDEGV